MVIPPCERMLLTPESSVPASPRDESDGPQSGDDDVVGRPSGPPTPIFGESGEVAGEAMVESGEGRRDRPLAEMTRSIVWNESDLHQKFGLIKRKTHSTKNMCLAFSYLSAAGVNKPNKKRCAVLFRVLARRVLSLCPCRSLVESAVALRNELLNTLEVELPPGVPDGDSWAFGSNRDKVQQFLYPKPVRVCIPLTRRCTQVRNIAENDLFLNEAYIHALANVKNIKIVIASPKPIGPHWRIGFVLYEPGWTAQGEIPVETARSLLSEPGVHWYHLAKDHFSWLQQSAGGTSTDVNLLSPSPPSASKKRHQPKRQTGKRKERAIVISDEEESIGTP